MNQFLYLKRNNKKVLNIYGCVHTKKLTEGKFMSKKFVLSENFISKYKRKKAPFGFNGLGELVYMRTYSRIKENGKNERWWETVQRVVEGTYQMQMNHIESHQLGWNPWQAQKSAQEMYDRIFNMKFLPPGRGLWAMGTANNRKERFICCSKQLCFRINKNSKRRLR